jgi:hypothetical protein
MDLYGRSGITPGEFLKGSRGRSSVKSLSKSGAAKTGGLVVVTGFKELDEKLKGMPAAIQRKFIRGALRKGGKRAVLEAKRIIRAEAKDTGALEKSVTVKSLKRSRKRIGVSIMPKRDKLFANYAAKHDGKTPRPAKGESDPFYYAAAVEFGTPTNKPIAPFRRALYDNSEVIIAYFRADVLQFIAENKVTTKL